MGVVLRAEDMLLRRSVALKVLSAEGAPDEEHRARWLREIQSAAALNHPAICMIYEAGEIQPGLVTTADCDPEGDPLPAPPAAGSPYFTMELIEGRSLATILKEEGPLPWDLVIENGLAIADGLAAAHAAGVVHRDLKPGNVMITTDGRVKILDFGLARQVEPGHPREGPADSVLTLSRELSRDGRVLGTVAYIAPERALGKRGTSQSDVFSFGVILYEMVSGVRPFQGETTTAILAKILEAEPVAPARIRPDLPPALGRIIARCLRKAPEERYNDTRDLVAALRELRERMAAAHGGAARVPAADATTGWVAPPPPRASLGSGPASSMSRGSRWGWMRPRSEITTLGLAVLVVAVSTAAVLFARKEPASQHPRTEIRRITWSQMLRYPAISADGNFIAWVNQAPGEPHALVLQDVRSGATIQLHKGGLLGKDHTFSPDGSEILFSEFSGDGGACTLKIVPILGGHSKELPPGLIAPTCWSPDGSRVASGIGRNRVVIFDRRTGAADTLRIRSDIDPLEGLAWSSHAPLLLLYGRAANGGRGVVILRLDDRTERVLDLRSGLYGCPQWASEGRALYFTPERNEILMRLPVDPETGEPRGAPIPLGIQVAGRFSVAGNGKTLAFEQVYEKKTVVRIDLAPGAGGEMAAREIEVQPEGTRVDCPRISPSADRLAWVRAIRVRDRNMYTLEVASHDGQTLQTLYQAEGGIRFLSWSPDGEAVAFRLDRQNAQTPAIVDRSGERVRFLDEVPTGGVVEWADADHLVIERVDRRNYTVLNVRTGEQRALLDRDVLAVFQARRSPDGKLIAYARNLDRESGMSVSIVPLDGGPERTVWHGRAAPIGWSTDGTKVFLARDDPATAGQGLRREQVVACPIDGGPAESICNIPAGSPWSEMDVSPDGLRIFYARVVGASSTWIATDFDPAVR